MKRSGLVLLFIFLCSLFLPAQTDNASDFRFTSIEDQIREYNRQAKNLPTEKAGEMLNLARKAYSLAEMENLKELSCESEALMGIAYFYLLEIDKSLQFLSQSYDRAEKYQYTELRAFSAYNMGIVYTYLEDKEKALELFRESFTFAGMEKTDQKILILKALSETYRDLEMFAEAAKYAENAYIMAEELGENLRMQELQLLAGEIDYKNGKFRESVGRLISIIRETGDDSRFISVRSLAMSLLGRNYALLKDYTRALSYGQEALLAAVSSSNEKNRLEAYSALAFIFRQMNNYEEAFNYLSLYYEQKEIYERGRNEKNLNNIKANYETLEKEKEIDEQRNRIDSQNRLILYGALMLICLLALLFIFYLLYRKNSRIVEKLSRDLKREMVLSKTDSATGLPNRKAIEEKIRELYLQWKSNGKDFSLLFLSFKEHSHLDEEIAPGTGELFQKYIGDILNKELKGQDTIALWKPFVFSILMPSTDLESLVSVRHKLGYALKECRFSAGDKEIALSFKSASSVYNGEGTLKDFLDLCREQLKAANI
ncbi:MAG: tetratricopeptide repeat protein [Spirochaetales bacterium]|nr:tetratricopeptide repeat protein [Spirochaetales bacterium]